jgi:DNA-binding MarR family transcriptional regulator
MPKYCAKPNLSPKPNDRAVEDAVEAWDRFHLALMRLHVPDFVELKLTLAQLKALYLVAATGPMRMTQVAERLGTAPSTTTGVVDGLVQLGLLERNEDSADRRQVVVQATDAAQERLEHFSELGRSRLRELLARIEHERDRRTIERAITLLTDAAGGVTTVTEKDTTE